MPPLCPILVMKYQPNTLKTMLEIVINMNWRIQGRKYKENCLWFSTSFPTTRVRNVFTQVSNHLLRPKKTVTITRAEKHWDKRWIPNGAHLLCYSKYEHIFPVVVSDGYEVDGATFNNSSDKEMCERKRVRGWTTGLPSMTPVMSVATGAAASVAGKWQTWEASVWRDAWQTRDEWEGLSCCYSIERERERAAERLERAPDERVLGERNRWVRNENCRRVPLP